MPTYRFHFAKCYSLDEKGDFIRWKSKKPEMSNVSGKITAVSLTRLISRLSGHSDLTRRGVSVCVYMWEMWWHGPRSAHGTMTPLFVLPTDKWVHGLSFRVDTVTHRTLDLILSFIELPLTTSYEAGNLIYTVQQLSRSPALWSEGQTERYFFYLVIQGTGVCSNCPLCNS